MERGIAFSDIAQKVKNLRTKELKRHREIREACLFAYGMAQRIEQQVWVYPEEDADYDFVASWEVGGERHFAPTQIKEVVPEHLNPDSSLQSVISGLAKYKASRGLTVVVHLNRQIRFDPDQVSLANLELASLWIIGAVSADQHRWMLFGNMMEAGAFRSEFEYPE